MSKRTLKNRLNQVFAATNTMKILFFLLSPPDEELFDREISRRTGISPAGTNLALRELAEAGLLERIERGRMKFYRLIPRDPLLRHLKIVRSLALLHDLAEGLKPHALRIVLFGSASRGEDTLASDIDLFLLARERKDVMKIIADSDLSEKLKPAIFTPQEWAGTREMNLVFAEEVEKGIVLWDETLSANSMRR